MTKPARPGRPGIGGVALIALVGGYWYFTQDKTPPRARRVPIPVRVGAVTHIRHAGGGTHPGHRGALHHCAGGRARPRRDRKAVFQGRPVRSRNGDLLFVIDPRPYQAAYDNALATLATAKAKADRYQKLLAQNAIAPQDQDDAQAAYLVAKSNAEAARLNLEFTQIRSPVDGKTGPILVQPGNMVIGTPP